MNSLGFIVWLLVWIPIISGEDAPTSIKVLPSNRLTAGREVTIICTLNSRGASETVLWWRKIGEIKHKLGLNTMLEPAYSATNRYQISQWGEDGVVSYRLQIIDLHYEDTAQIGCSVRSASKSPPAYVTFAVCHDDLETVACKCMATKGWTDINCFKRHSSITELENRYQRTVIGLGVCFAIVVIFGLVMSVLVGWDCMARMAAKQKKRQAMAKANATRTRDIYHDSETLKMDPNETNSDFEGQYRDHPPERAYPRLSSQHVNHAYTGDDDGYQEIGATASAPPIGYHPNGVGAHGPTVAIVNPEPKVVEPLRTVSGGAPYIPTAQEVYADDYHDVRSPGIPRTPADSLYPSTHYGDNQSPGSWSTKSAGAVEPPPPGFRFPDPNYNGSSVSPRDVMSNPRNAYSERPVRENPNKRNRHAEPRKLDFVGEQSKYGSPHNRYDDDDDDDYAVNPSGAYIDKTDTVV